MTKLERFKEHLQASIWSVLNRIYGNRFGFLLWKTLLPHTFLHKRGMIWYWDEYLQHWECDSGFNIARAKSHWWPLVRLAGHFHEDPRE